MSNQNQKLPTIVFLFTMSFFIFVGLKCALEVYKKNKVNVENGYVYVNAKENTNDQSS